MDDVERAPRLESGDAPRIARMLLVMLAGIGRRPVRAVPTVCTALEPIVVAKRLRCQKEEPNVGPSEGYFDHDLAHEAKAESERGAMPAEDGGLGGMPRSALRSSSVASLGSGGRAI